MEKRSREQRRLQPCNSTAERSRGCGAESRSPGGIGGVPLFTVFEEWSTRELNGQLLPKAVSLRGETFEGGSALRSQHAALDSFAATSERLIALMAAWEMI